MAGAGLASKLLDNSKYVTANLTLRTIVTSPYTYGLLGVYAAAAAVRSSAGWSVAESFAGLALFTAIAMIPLLMTRNRTPPEIEIFRPRKEAFAVAAYFLGWLLLNLALWPIIFGPNPMLANGISFWLLLVIVPLAVVWKAGYRPRDIGLHSESLAMNIRSTATTLAVVSLILLLITPGGRFIRSGEVAPSTVALGIALSLGVSLLAAAVHEEVFFRAILQTRLAKITRSEVAGVCLATLAFGLYHLPFRLYQGPTAGHFAQSLAGCLTETILAAPVLGFLWARTRSLLGPVLVHAAIDTISGTQKVMEVFGLLP